MPETPTIPVTLKSQHSRYVADNSAFSGYFLNARDHQLIESVYSHRFLDTELLWHLVRPDNPKTEEKREGKDGKFRPVRQSFGIKALYRRLQRLYHQGYLTRHFASDSAIGRGSGSPRAIYGIGPKSVSILAKTLRIPPHQIRQLVDSNWVQSPFLRHTLDVSHFRVILELACRKVRNTARLVFWDQGLHLRNWVTGKNEIGEPERFCMYPDAFFAFQTGENRRLHYFLELDRGTEPIIASSSRSDIRRKMFGYFYCRQYRQFRSPYAPEMKGFTVLFLIAGDKANDHLETGRISNILNVMPMFGEGFKSTSLFWFAEMRRLSLERSESVFEPLWRSNRRTASAHCLID